VTVRITLRISSTEQISRVKRVDIYRTR